MAIRSGSNLPHGLVDVNGIRDAATRIAAIKFRENIMALAKQLNGLMNRNRAPDVTPASGGEGGGEDGDTYTPSIREEGEGVFVDFTNTDGEVIKGTVNIKGEDGIYYAPCVSREYGGCNGSELIAQNLTFVKTDPDTPPQNEVGPFNILGEKGKAGGYYTPSVDVAGSCGTGTEITLKFSPNSIDGATEVSCSFIIPKGCDGQDGVTPTIAIGCVKSGCEADAEITGGPDYILNMTIPKGADGKDGGYYTPEVSAEYACQSTSSGDVTVTISMKPSEAIGGDDVSCSFIVKAGQDGESPDPPTFVITRVTSGDCACVSLSKEGQNDYGFEFTIPHGQKGDPGEDAPSPTLAIGCVTEGASAAAEICGQSPNYTLNLTIPRGGDGEAPNLEIGTVTSGTCASASIGGTSPNYILNLVLPKGEDGTTPTFCIGTVSSGCYADVTMDGSVDTNYKLNFILPKGEPGKDAVVPEFEVESVVSGCSASVSLSKGDDGNYGFNFVIPKGDKGDSPTFGVNSTSSGDVANVSLVPGSGCDYAFNFVIPKGEKGDCGCDGHTPTFGIHSTSSGSSADVGLVAGSGCDYAFKFILPKGDTGPAPNLSIGTVTTGCAGTNASASIRGQNPNYILDLTIPRGDKGDGASLTSRSIQVVTDVKYESNKLWKRTATISVYAPAALPAGDWIAYTTAVGHSTQHSCS